MAAEQVQVQSGRLSLTLWRPSGVASKDKFHFEVVVDFQVVYKSPQMQHKKPEWMCNVCCDASLDSLIMIRLYKGSGKSSAEPDKCHVRLNGLQLGVERSTSLEFPNGERQQVTQLALNFGERDVCSPQREEVEFDAPNVMDVSATALHDLNGLDRKPVVLQACYSDQAMRSNKFSVDPESAHVGDVQLDATFRLCAATTHVQLLLMQGDSFPGEVVAAARLSAIRWSAVPQPCFVPLRDRDERVRAYVQLRVSLSTPLRGLLAYQGPPLVGVPMRLDWGDVVLFNLKSLNAQLVSAATASSWDHCGIVYEENGKLFLLEAVSGGVQTPELNGRLLDALGQGAKIGFRHLSVGRSPELKAQLWTFAVGMTGRSYKKSVGQLVGSRWGRNKADDLSSVFCSELVAAAFKHLELLPDSVVTSNVLPKDVAAPDFALQHASLAPLVAYSSKVYSMLKRHSGGGKRVSDLQTDWVRTEDSSFSE